MPPNLLPDLLIAGAGPAGLACAVRAVSRGLTVRVVDRARRPPVDKPCGEGLMPDGLERLAELGVDPAALGGRPFRGIRYLGDGAIAEGRFPGPPGLGVRRLKLHEALMRRAEEVGVEVEWGVKVTGLAGGGLETSAGRLEGRCLVAADGLRSPLRRQAGLAGRPSRWRRFGVRRHFGVSPWSDCVEVYWAEGCEAYVTPVGPQEVGVAILWSDGGRSEGTAGFDSLLARFPALTERVVGASHASRDRGTGPLRQRTQRVMRGRLALLGDASGYVDAITGEGLSLAFHQAFALVDAVEREDLGLYEAASRRLRRLPDAMTHLLLALERRPWLRRRALRALAADPALFSLLLGIHSRSLPPSRLGASGLARIAWRLATA